MTTSRKSLYANPSRDEAKTPPKRDFTVAVTEKIISGASRLTCKSTGFGEACGVLVNARDTGGVNSIERWPLRPERPTQARTPPTAHAYARDARRGLPRFDYGNGPDVLPALRQPPSYRVPI